MAGSSEAESGAPESVGGDLRSFTALATSLVGLVGYVYLFGGLVTWVRLTTARLPGGTLTALAQPRTLLVVGVEALLFVVAAFAVVCVLCYLIGRIGWSEHRRDWYAVVVHRGVARATAAREEGLLHETPPDDVASHRHAPLGEGAVRTVAGFNVLVLAVLIGLAVARVVELIFPNWIAIVAFFAVAAFAVWRLATWGPLHWRSHIAAIVLALAVAFFAAAPIGVLVIASVAIALLGRRIARLERPRSAVAFLHSPLLWGLLAIYVLVGLAFSAQPPVSFTRAALETRAGRQLGGYLGRSSDGVYLATCTGLANATSRTERAVLVPAAEIERTTLGGQRYTFDSGERPSLATIALHALGIDAHPPTWFHADLQSQESTCDAELAPDQPGDALGNGALVGPAPPGGRASGGEAPIAETSPALAELARRYQPTLEVTVADRFWPVSVASVLQSRGSFVHGLRHDGHRTTCLVRGGSCVAAPPTLADLTPVGASEDDYLDYPASFGRGDPTSEFSAFLRGQGTPLRRTGDWLADPAAAIDPWRSAQLYVYDAGVGGYGRRYPGAPPGLRSLQYWFFYPYNYYPTVVARRLMATSPIAADLANADLHEGDWEHVSVLLDPRSREPRFLYMARHDLEGVTLPWDSKLLRFENGHPIVQAALGGHPTYPNGCEEHLREILKNLGSDWLVCGSGRFVFRAETTPLVDLARASWACWPGHFGEATAAQVRNAQRGEADPRRALAKYVVVAGPRSPLRQAENADVCRAR
ncbi:MAG TPA: hypothetical protein VKB03_16505 [Conexibacter sp.]|nr:hypothetical protein [Conexibacter sp.]